MAYLDLKSDTYSKHIARKTQTSPSVGNTISISSFNDLYSEIERIDELNPLRPGGNKKVTHT